MSKQITTSSKAFDFLKPHSSSISSFGGRSVGINGIGIMCICVHDDQNENG